MPTSDERRFPIMGGPSVPWRMIEPYAAQAKANHDQTLERLAQRGGLDPCELYCIVHGTAWWKVRSSLTLEQARAWLDAWLAADDERTKRADRAEARVKELEVALRDAVNTGDVLLSGLEVATKQTFTGSRDQLTKARAVLDRLIGERSAATDNSE